MPRSKSNIVETTDVQAEIRKFKMHPDLLFSVIQSQAGTAEKALLEAVMNAVDAGATKCDILLDEKGYTVSDDGKGFQSRKEVDEFFETFGTPHTEGDATYGRFRMGRGQLFAFSSTIWKTNTFQMEVDIKKTGLDYKFLENQALTNGCTILGKWYEPIGTQGIFNLTKELERLVKYMQIPVTVNDKKISIDVDKQTWDYKEPDFRIKVNKSVNTLAVYNMGALVSNYPASRFGVGGTVVTHSALKVNFARNDVLVSQCSLWKKITKKLNEVMGVEVAKKTVLNDAEREALLNQVINGQVFMHEVWSKGLLTDISGKKISFKTLLAASKITFSTGSWKNKKLEERINDSKVCLVLANSVLDVCDVADTASFVDLVNSLIENNNKPLLAQRNKLQAQAQRNGYYSQEYWDIGNQLVQNSFAPIQMDILKLLATIKSESDIITDKLLTKKQKIFVKALNELSRAIAMAILVVESRDSGQYWDYTKVTAKTRKVMLGKSEVAEGWTDGASYIVVEEKQINVSPFKLVQLMVHEYCHDDSTLESHDHGTEFFELFHAVNLEAAAMLDTALTSFMRSYNKELLKAGIQPKRDYDFRIAEADKQEPNPAS